MKIRWIVLLIAVMSLIGVNALAIDLPGTARAIKAGKVNVGKTTGMEQGGRRSFDPGSGGRAEKQDIYAS